MKWKQLSLPALNPNKTFAAVICAAGRSSRMNGVKKEYCLLPMSDKTVLGAAVSAFAAFPQTTAIVITVPDETDYGEEAAKKALPPELLPLVQCPCAPLSNAGLLPSRPAIIFVAGGETRRASVHNALCQLAAYQPDYVLIHDGARPKITPAFIEQIFLAVQQFDAVVPILPLTETPKEIDAPLAAHASGDVSSAGPVYITRHLRRSLLGTAQTPQAFAFSEILAAHEKAAQKERAEEYEYTDDAEVWGEFCGPVAAVPGLPENRKITFPHDLEWAGV